MSQAEQPEVGEHDAAVFDQVADWATPAAASPLAPYFYDPVGFARDCIKWPEGQALTEYQEDGLTQVVDKKRISIRSMHGAGKTTFCAIFILWFALTREAMCAGGDFGISDWKIVITAGAWRQLEKFLMPEVHKWAMRLDWELIGRKPFKTTELQRLGLRLDHGEATALASDNVALIEGAHADAIAYLFDESKAIKGTTFDAAEGAFVSEDDEVEGGALEAFALSTSTPGEPNGRFWEIQTQQPGYDDWTPLHWTLERVMKTGRVTKTWVERRKKQFGEKSALYANRVLGNFHSADEDGVIPLSWIEEAVERWKANHDEELYGPETEEFPAGQYLGEIDGLGVDVARMGEDRTVLALGLGHRVVELRTYFHDDTMATAGHVVGVLRGHPGIVPTVDTDGLGAGVTDRVREMGYEVTAFHAGEKSEAVDRSGELGFLNIRAEAWWQLRELLNPAYGAEAELPDDPELLGDLTAPKWKILSNGRIQIESKDDIKKRLERSTDRGDAVVMYFHQPVERDDAYMGSMGADEEEDWEDDVA